MTKNIDADNYHLAQAQKLFNLFEAAHGRTPSHGKELTDWLASPAGRAALAPHLDKDGKVQPHHA